MSDRGMKKWNAYKSLPEHTPAVRGAINNHYKVPRPTISNEEAELINEILVEYHGEEVVITYYRNNELFEIETVIVKIDKEMRRLILPEKDKILFSEIVGLKHSR